MAKTENVASHKDKALKLTLDKLDKQYGKGTVMKLGESPTVEVDVISTGSIALDAALGIGGLPRLIFGFLAVIHNNFQRGLRGRRNGTF